MRFRNKANSEINKDETVKNKKKPVEINRDFFRIKSDVPTAMTDFRLKSTETRAKNR